MFAHVSRIAMIAGLAITGATAAHAQSGDPIENAPAYSWMSISGEVVEVNKGDMRVDYGQGIVTVESASLGTFDGSSGDRMRVGEEVTVNGYIGGTFYDDPVLNASSIVREDSQSVDYGVNDPDMDLDPAFFSASMQSEGDTSFTGQVAEVDGREFTLVTGGGRELTVDTSQMDYNPLDTIGAQKIDRLDRVSVSGELDGDVFEDGEFMAQDIMVLINKDKPGPT